MDAYGIRFGPTNTLTQSLYYCEPNEDPVTICKVSGASHEEDISRGQKDHQFSRRSSYEVS
jgi:hypothetical protein